MKVQTIICYPKLTGAVLAFVSLLAGVIALVGADLGAPGWLLVPSLVWLATIGLPATVTVLLLAAVWGTVSPLHGFGPFCILAAGLVAVSEVLFVKCAAYLAGACHEN